MRASQLSNLQPSLAIAHSMLFFVNDNKSGEPQVGPVHRVNPDDHSGTANTCCERITASVAVLMRFLFIPLLIDVMTVVVALLMAVPS